MPCAPTGRAPGRPPSTACSARWPPPGWARRTYARSRRSLGLSVADKPAAPCLASRIPHFRPVTPEKLRQIDLAEASLRGLGFGDVRVRHHDEVARLELPIEDLARAAAYPLRLQVLEAVRAAGFRFVALDLAGIQSGAFTLPLVAVARA